MTRARLLGRVRPAWCPTCHAPPGPDCPRVGRTPRQQRRAEQRDLAQTVKGVHRAAT